MERETRNLMTVIWVIYQFWIFIQGTSFAVSFTRDLRNLTIIYKPNAFIYHFCQISDSINPKRIRWHYESLHNSMNDTELHCKYLLNNSNCFDFYYGPSTSVLVVKEPDMFIGKYTCHVNINSTYEIKSIGWIDVKIPANNIKEDVQFESQLGRLANCYDVPFIFDENDLISFGKGIDIGGMFYTECKSIESSYPIHFIWMHLKNTPKGIKTIQFVQHDGSRIIIKENRYSSSLSISSVDLSDDGDYVCIASNALGRSFSSIRSLIVSDTPIKPILSYSDVQSRSVVLHWRVLDRGYDRSNHFIIYYRRLNNFDENLNEQDEMMNMEDYKQILVDPRSIDDTFTYRMINLIPFTRYEFRLQSCIGATIYSNPIFIETLETLPEKIENLHGYIWNETSVVIHWTSPNSTNGPHFYYVLYYTINTSIPFDQWSNIIIRTYPFHILSLPIFTNFQLFIRIATVNIKGSILSDFYVINYNSSNSRTTSTIDQFRCLSDNQNQLLSLQWSIDQKSPLFLEKYLLYYSDLTQENDDLIQILTIPINHQSSKYLFEYKFNISLFNLNYNHYHILRLYLAIIDQNKNQFPLISSSIYCIFTRKFEIDCQG